MQIDGNTAIVGIIADPIGHVRTPQLFNESVARQGLNAACVPLHVSSEQLTSFLVGASALRNLHGLVVTIPHKEAVINACSELTETARIVGSANVLRYDGPARGWTGANFDGDGFVTGLRRQGHDIRGQRVLLVGAGGAGKSIAYALCRERPRQLAIHNRSQSRAAELVESLRKAVPDVDIETGGNDPSAFDVVVNATSLGLSDFDELPFDANRLAPSTLVCDVVVRAGGTQLISAARQRGCTVHRGQHMLYGQIVEIAQFLGVPLQGQFVAKVLAL